MEPPAPVNTPRVSRNPSIVSNYIRPVPIAPFVDNRMPVGMLLNNICLSSIPPPSPHRMPYSYIQTEANIFEGQNASAAPHPTSMLVKQPYVANTCASLDTDDFFDIDSAGETQMQVSCVSPDDSREEFLSSKIDLMFGTGGSVSMTGFREISNLENNTAVFYQDTDIHNLQMLQTCISSEALGAGILGESGASVTQYRTGEYIFPSDMSYDSMSH